MSGNIAGLTDEELAKARNKKHDLDDPKFIAWVKKMIKDRTMRINEYTIRTISDGKMLRLDVEKFIKGVSKGTRAIKGYLSEAKCDELVKLLDAITRKHYIDSRDKVSRERPVKVIQTKRDIAELNLDKLWD